MDELKFQVGQQWKARNGEIRTITKVLDPSLMYPIYSDGVSGQESHSILGSVWISIGRIHPISRPLDLVELISSSPSPDTARPNEPLAPGELKEQNSERLDPTLRNNNQQGKLPLHLIPAEWEMFLAEVLAFGATKYPEDSWKNYTNIEALLASSRRHILKYRLGEDHDPESNLHHLAPAAWNLLAALSLIVGGKTDRTTSFKKETK